MRFVEVYTHAGCPGGDAAIQFMDERAIPYRIHDVMEDPEARVRLQTWGCRETPVIVLDHRIVRGFDPAVIEQWWNEATTPEK